MKKFGLYNKFSTVPEKADELADILVEDWYRGAVGVWILPH